MGEKNGQVCRVDGDKIEVDIICSHAAYSTRFSGSVTVQAKENTMACIEKPEVYKTSWQILRWAIVENVVCGTTVPVFTPLLYYSVQRK